MRWVSHGLLVLILVLVAACAPKKPTLTPHSVQVTGVGFAGVRLTTDLSAYNPNGFNLTVQAVSGRIVLNDAVPLGTATTPTRVLLPAHGWQRFLVDLELPWLNLPAVLAVANTQQQVPYSFEGNATVGGKIRVTVPVQMRGTVPARDLLRAGSGISVATPSREWPELLAIGRQSQAHAR
jgi:LEA14-like dessication related protein